MFNLCKTVKIYQNINHYHIHKQEPAPHHDPNEVTYYQEPSPPHSNARQSY